MPNDENELTEAEEALTKNIAIFFGNLLKIYYLLPKKTFALLSFIIFFIIKILGSFSLIFEYDKIDLDTINLDTILNLFTLEVISLILLSIVISFSILLTVVFYNYIAKNEKKISQLKQTISISEADFNDKIKLLEEQKASQPIFINKDLIKNMIIEIENHVLLKENTEMIEKYLPILEIKLRNNRIIEVTASKNDDSIVAERMIFEIWRQKQIKGSLVHDPYGLVSVYSCSEDSFKSTLIGYLPEEDYWDKMVRTLKENTSKHVDDLYLKVFIPTEIDRTDKETLNDLLTGLNEL